MTESEVWTIKRLLQWTTDYFGRQGAESPRLDAEVLLAEARKCQRIELYTAFDQVPDQHELTAFRELVRRRGEGTPVAYLAGRREFYSLNFRVTPDVLIPRPETEFVVLALLDLVKQRDGSDQPLAIADVGTGSGILAICAALHIPQARITAIDVSPAALEVARANAAAHDVADRVEWLTGDLLAAVTAEQRFDFIVSNPPYVSHSEFADLPVEVRQHEPQTALVGGPSGTEVIARLVTQAARHLDAHGWLICEISPMIETVVHDLIIADGNFGTPHTVTDLAKLARVVKAQRVGRSEPA